MCRHILPRPEIRSLNGRHRSDLFAGLFSVAVSGNACSGGFTIPELAVQPGNVVRYPQASLREEWDEVEAWARALDEIHQVGANASWYRNFRAGDSTHLLGCAAQWGVAKIFGLPHGLIVNPSGGDGGSDIGPVDIKGTTYWPPVLKHPANASHWPEYFALAHVVLGLRVVTFIGVVPSAALRGGPGAELRTWNEQAGPQWSLDAQSVWDVDSKAPPEQKFPALALQSVQATRR